MCDCIQLTNEALAKTGWKLDIPITITSAMTMQTIPRVMIRVVQINPQPRAKTPNFLATYCPFCGKAYEDGLLDEKDVRKV